jgi:hypothetical protein
MPEQWDDQREFSRVLFKTNVGVFVGERVIWSDEGINIGMRGLRLSTSEPAPPGAQCRVVIRLNTDNDPTIIEAKGKIVRAGTNSLAVEFTELDLNSYHHLRRLILLNAEDPEKAEREFVAHWGIRRAAP